MREAVGSSDPDRHHSKQPRSASWQAAPETAMLLHKLQKHKISQRFAFVFASKPRPPVRFRFQNKTPAIAIDGADLRPVAYPPGRPNFAY